ncbi:hypothetical protein HWX41_27135 [Bacillus paramycoides]|uniref:hypothetical protein n=1 Tax=Bacillus paramycoides TaxID=2026194 RepID=UPI0015B94834|nr:hypothetical protein [Bacillus paramycoides]NWK72598.1 hypothetical protein [Bacillus paramycoides]
MLRENLLLNNYEGHIEASEIEPSHDLIYFLCGESLGLFNGCMITSEHCKCGGSMNVYQVVEGIPFDEFKELSSIAAIELYFCTFCKKWKLDFIG